jgi:hypothetical protein
MKAFEELVIIFESDTTSLFVLSALVSNQMIWLLTKQRIVLAIYRYTQAHYCIPYSLAGPLGQA